MKTLPQPSTSPLCRGGFSLIELSLVLALILGLAVFIGFGFTSVRQWQSGKNAALALQAVYAAQRAYMADNPFANIAQVPASQILPYLPQGWSTLPVLTGLQGQPLTLNFAVMPPVLLDGGATYDPSGKPNDGLWDVGE